MIEKVISSSLIFLSLFSFIFVIEKLFILSEFGIGTIIYFKYGYYYKKHKIS